VSLSLTDYYCASIAPGSAALLRMRRGWRPAVAHKSVASAAVQSTAAPWQAELGLLEGLLREARRGLPLNIVISNHYLRYRLLPAPPLSMPEAGVQALLLHCFRETYGDAADGWYIRANPMPERGDVVACAVDRALIEGLKAAAAKAGLKLASAQPYLMNGFNAACRSMAGAPACFVQAEPGRIMLGTMQDNNWLGLRAIAATSRWQEELPAHIEREILLAGWENASPAVFLHAPDAGYKFTAQDTQRWQLKRVATRPVDGYSTQDDMACAMALSGVR